MILTGNSIRAWSNSFPGYGADMDEQTVRTLVEGIVRNVVREAGSTVPCAVDRSGSGEAIPVEISARHVHLSEGDALALFGGPLTPARELSQPGQFLCKERVRLIGPKAVMDNVAVLGPARGQSQVEISATDARILGVAPPVRQSGDAAGTPGIILASQTGIVGLEQGLIVAMRHIHMTPEDARRFGVADKELVGVRIEGERPVILEDVLVRVHESFRLVLHIDADEGNGSGWTSGAAGRIVARNGRSGTCISA